MLLFIIIIIKPMMYLWRGAARPSRRIEVWCEKIIYHLFLFIIYLLLYNLFDVYVG